MESLKWKREDDEFCARVIRSEKYVPSWGENWVYGSGMSEEWEARYEGYSPDNEEGEEENE